MTTIRQIVSATQIELSRAIAALERHAGDAEKEAVAEPHEWCAMREDRDMFQQQLADATAEIQTHVADRNEAVRERNAAAALAATYREAEVKWEKALSEASGGRYDMPAGIAQLVREMKAGPQRAPALAGLVRQLEEATSAVVVRTPRETFRISGLPPALFARLLAHEGKRVLVNVEFEAEPAGATP